MQLNAVVTLILAVVVLARSPATIPCGWPARDHSAVRAAHLVHPARHQQPSGEKKHGRRQRAFRRALPPGCFFASMAALMYGTSPGHHSARRSTTQDRSAEVVGGGLIAYAAAICAVVLGTSAIPSLRRNVMHLESVAKAPAGWGRLLEGVYRGRGPGASSTRPSPGPDHARHSALPQLSLVFRFLVRVPLQPASLELFGDFGGRHRLHVNV